MSRPITAAPALKLGIDTPDAKTSVEPSERDFDKILVYEPYFQRPLVAGTLYSETITQDKGLWWLVDINGLGIMQTPRRTIAEWLVDPQFGERLTRGTIRSIQIGLGSSNAGASALVESIALTHSRTRGESKPFYFTSLRAARSAGWDYGHMRGNGRVAFPDEPGGQPARLLMSTPGSKDKSTLHKRGSFGRMDAFSATYVWIVPEIL